MHASEFMAMIQAAGYLAGFIYHDWHAHSG